MIWEPGSRKAACIILGLIWTSAVPVAVASADLPAPVSVPPSGLWDGIDGSWSSFNISIGNPPQISRVFASWMTYQMWVVHPLGCPDATVACANARGGLFYKNESTSWDEKGVYGLAGETNLGVDGNGIFGFDSAALGATAQQLLPVSNATVVDFAVTEPYLGMLGINPKPTNWTSYTDYSQSYISQLKQTNSIPSVSFGYTAGAAYRSSKTLASLTLGGYDESRFDENNIEFTLAPDNSRDTVVAVQSITASQNSSTGPANLLPSPIYALVDAAAAEIWLPIEACQAFEQQFGLQYDNNTELYLVNSTTHSTLVARNATFSFTVAQETSGGATIVIDLPYAAFNLTAKSPYRQLANDTLYFPLRRAQNSTQYTLGRTFMQEAYISVNYETAKFNLSKTVWTEGVPEKLVAMQPASSTNNAATASPSGTPSANDSGLGVGAIAGIVTVTLLLCLAGVAAFLLRKQKTTKKSTGRLGGDPKGKSSGVSSRSDTLASKSPSCIVTSTSVMTTPSSVSTPTTTTPTSPDWQPGQMPLSPMAYSAEGSMSVSEADGTPLHELPGSLPEFNMADGRQITEKEMMRYRERLYNGYDSVEERRQGERERSLRVQGERRREVLLPGQIREATEEEGGNRRFSFVAGEDRIS
ncbi:acid protease [Myriangium duriaei CBS 260.36]|uniref:Acid protease n=1 Tax=Myriangium duriaei CBS 260.36 TaxID=1168546 RepID=A0A9P4MMA1_9PEZI|nr:acid protease [Myriangium duriaei CBS 260.36]